MWRVSIINSNYNLMNWLVLLLITITIQYNTILIHSISTIIYKYILLLMNISMYKPWNVCLKYKRVNIDGINERIRTSRTNMDIPLLHWCVIMASMVSSLTSLIHQRKIISHYFIYELLLFQVCIKQEWNQYNSLT